MSRDVELVPEGVPQHTIATIQVTRLIVIEATSPDKPTDVQSISERTGYSPYQVRRILASDEYQEAVVARSKEIVAPLLVMALGRYQQVLQDPKLTLSGLNSVTREIRATWESLNKFSPIQNRDDRATQALSVLESIKARRSVITVTPPPEEKTA